MTEPVMQQAHMNDQDFPDKELRGASVHSDVTPFKWGMDTRCRGCMWRVQRLVNDQEIFLIGNCTVTRHDQ